MANVTVVSDLPTIQRIYADDFAMAPDWFRQNFIQTFNLFSQPVYNILNQGVSVSENTVEEFYSFTLTSTGVFSKDIFTFTPKKFVGKPNGVILCQCVANTNTVTPIGSAVAFDWVFGNGGTVQIIAIYGLTSGISYTLTVRIC
jgi:hypothetical protein